MHITIIYSYREVNGRFSGMVQDFSCPTQQCTLKLNVTKRSGSGLLADIPLTVFQTPTGPGSNPNQSGLIPGLCV